MFYRVNSIILTGTRPYDGKVKPNMSQSADVWLMLTIISRHHARVGDLKLTSKLAVMTCTEPEKLTSKLRVCHHTALLT